MRNVSPSQKTSVTNFLIYSLCARESERARATERQSDRSKMMMIAFITLKSRIVPSLEGLFVQIHLDSRSRSCSHFLQNESETEREPESQRARELEQGQERVKAIE